MKDECFDNVIENVKISKIKLNGELAPIKTLECDIKVELITDTIMKIGLEATAKELGLLILKSRYTTPDRNLLHLALGNKRPETFRPRKANESKERIGLLSDDSYDSATTCPLPYSMSEQAAVLRQLCQGPVWDGNLTSKASRDVLVGEGLVFQINGWNALTPAGVAYCVTVGACRSLKEK